MGSFVPRTSWFGAVVALSPDAMLSSCSSSPSSYDSLPSHPSAPPQAMGPNAATAAINVVRSEVRTVVFTGKAPARRGLVWHRVSWRRTDRKIWTSSKNRPCASFSSFLLLYQATDGIGCRHIWRHARHPRRQHAGSGPQRRLLERLLERSPRSARGSRRTGANCRWSRREALMRGRSSTRSSAVHVGYCRGLAVRSTNVVYDAVGRSLAVASAHDVGLNRVFGRGSGVTRDDSPFVEGALAEIVVGEAAVAAAPENDRAFLLHRAFPCRE